LRAQRIPYVISGGQSFFDRAEIKDITCYLRLLANPDDDPAFIRAVTTPKRGIGGTTLEGLGRAAGRSHQSLFASIWAPGLEAELNAKQRTSLREFGDFIKRIAARAAKEPAGKVLNDLIEAIGYESWLFQSSEVREAETRWANVRDLVEWLGRKGEEEGKNLLELAQSVALLSMLDKDEGEQDAVQLATLHAAKGLEFRHVFLVGVEEGLLPHRDSLEPAKLEEERRLMYVGITRAQASLTVTWCERRKQGREWMPREPSRFIAEMGEAARKAAGARQHRAGRRTARAKASALRAMLAGKPVYWGASGQSTSGGYRPQRLGADIKQKGPVGPLVSRACDDLLRRGFLDCRPTCSPCRQWSAPVRRRWRPSRPSAASRSCRQSPTSAGRRDPARCAAPRPPCRRSSARRRHRSHGRRRNGLVNLFAAAIAASRGRHRGRQLDAGHGSDPLVGGFLVAPWGGRPWQTPKRKEPAHPPRRMFGYSNGP
jgi:hypothetical protein